MIEEHQKGWSFCFVTGGTDDATYSACLESIYNEFDGRDDFEIISVGTSSLHEERRPKLKTVFFSEPVLHLSLKNFRRARKMKSFKTLFFRTGAISHKKNLAACHARFDKLCFLHDYVGLEPGWVDGFASFGEQWQVAMNAILNQDGTRHRDWMNWDHPAITPSAKNNSACLMPYHVTTDFMYISGTYFCVKRDFFLDNLLDETLFWGDGEDVEWSLRVRQKTKFVFNPFSKTKYRKLKDVHGAPYDRLWQGNQRQFEDALANGKIANGC